MVEVFKTNLDDPETAQSLIDELSHHFPAAIFHVDLEDCDRILRAQNQRGRVDAGPIIDFVSKRGYFIEVLPE